MTASVCLEPMELISAILANGELTIVSLLDDNRCLLYWLFGIYLDSRMGNLPGHNLWHLHEWFAFMGIPMTAAVCRHIQSEKYHPLKESGSEAGDPRRVALDQCSMYALTRFSLEAPAFFLRCIGVSGQICRVSCTIWMADRGHGQQAMTLQIGDHNRSVRIS
jgi:hypothetical protein